MNGQPHPRPPHRGVIVGLRVLFCLLPLISIGILAWAAPLRIAVLRRRPLDWALFCGALVLSVVLLVLVGELPESHWLSDVSIVGLMLMGPVCSVHYLVADILHHDALERRSRSGAFGHAHLPPNPYAQPPVPPARSPQPSGTGGPPGHHPAPLPPQPRARRIDQVRAELDELSEYLRQQEER